MDTKKVLGIIFSLIFVGAFAFVLSWGIINFNKVKEGMSGTELYTQEDLNNAYQDGYDTALTDKDEYDELINGYRDTITTQTDQISQLNSQISQLTMTNKDCETQITNLTNTKLDLQKQVANLTNIKTQNEATINSLNNEIVSLENQIKKLNESNEEKDEEIEVLNNQVSNLQALTSQLQTTNAMNVETINSLNSQITNLNAQISDLTMQIQNNSSNVTALNNKIEELEKSVAYYEAYIENLENGDQVVATFEYDGSVYNIQIVNKNSIVSVTNPTSTDYTIFNYWTVDGERVDLSTYSISTNTKFVANVTHKYDVKFMVNNENYNSQIIVENGYPTIPATPVVDGYEFDGWTKNGVDIVNPNTISITSNTTYYAKLTQLHTVTFMYEDEVLSTQQIRNGNYAQSVSVNNTDYKRFNGWLVNGTKVDISTYKITGAVVFVADITYSYEVTFIANGSTHNTQLITKNGYATLPTDPNISGYDFDGWSLNGVDIINNITTTKVTANTTYYAVLTKLHTVTFKNGNTTVNTQTVRNNEYAKYVSIDNTTYEVFNGWTLNGSSVDVTTYKITSATIFTADITYYEYQFEAVSFSGLTDFKGNNVWTDGTNTYYSSGTTHYVFNKNTNTWTTKTWYGLSNFTGYRIWTDGTDIYWAGSTTWYVLNKSTSTWSEKTWGGSFSTIKTQAQFNTDNSIWTDGINTYFSCLSNQFVLNKSTGNWDAVTWNGLTSFYGTAVWSDGTNIYYSWGSSHYQLDVATKTWTSVSFSGLSSFHGHQVWTNGDNFYMSKNADHYVLDVATKKWTKFTWDNGLSYEASASIWTDGTSVYCSTGTEHYKLVLKEVQ